MYFFFVAGMAMFSPPEKRIDISLSRAPSTSESISGLMLANGNMARIAKGEMFPETMKMKRVSVEAN